MQPALVVAALLAALPVRAAETLDDSLAAVAGAPHVPALRRSIDAAVARATGKDAGAAAFVRAAIARNLAEKRALAAPGQEAFALTPAAIERTVIDYEAFKYATYLSAGVFPKRYFGYFDGRWDTAAYEKRMRRVVRAAVEVVNAAQARAGSPVRITDAEVAVTFVAEGGAVLLREKQGSLEAMHPVMDIGLDDIASGFAQHAPLVRALDARLGTRLAEIVVPADAARGTPAMLARHMTFDEGLLGTAVMYVWEKEIAATKLRREGRRAIHELPLDEQFVIGSLVYNSGLLFSAERVEMIRDFRTGEYLRGVSDANARKRWPLPVFGPERARLRLLGPDGDYPDQPTSWSAVYHVLQRYGAFAALRRFTDVFDDRGMFRAAD